PRAECRTARKEVSHPRHTGWVPSGLSAGADPPFTEDCPLRSAGGAIPGPSAARAKTAPGVPRSRAWECPARPQMSFKVPDSLAEVNDSRSRAMQPPPKICEDRRGSFTRSTRDMDVPSGAETEVGMLQAPKADVIVPVDRDPEAVVRCLES